MVRFTGIEPQIAARGLMLLDIARENRMCQRHHRIMSELLDGKDPRVVAGLHSPT